MNPRDLVVICCICIGLWMCLVPSATGQVLVGPWVQESQARIEKHRKTEIRVLVLDAEGQPVPNARVHLNQTSHEFPLGFVVPASGWPEAYRAEGVVWRCFNTASLDRHTPWTVIEPQEGRGLDTASALALMNAAEAHGLDIWWGGVLSADKGRGPSHLVKADDDVLSQALDSQVDRVIGPHGRRVAAFDLYTHALDHDLIESRLGDAMLRRLFDRARALSPQASLRIRLHEVMDRRRSFDAVRKVTAWHESFIRFDAVAIDQRFLGRVEPTSVRLSLDRLEGLRTPLVFSALEVSGEQPLETALSLETVLRVLFASPSVEGICLAGVTPDDAAAVSAALFDDEGRPTAAGAALDNLFWKLWRTDEKRTADELGNVYARVFPGNYEIAATLTDGTLTTSLVRVSKSDEQKLVVVQPNKGDPRKAPDQGSASPDPVE